MLAAAAQQQSTWGVVFSILLTAFVTGLLARFAVPGPDPMPVWLTIVIGLLGSLIGSGIVYAIEGHHDVSWAGIASFFSAIGLVLAYRYFIQKRPIWGQGAYRFPERGFGVETQRERLRKAGIDPDQIGQAGPFGVPRPVGVGVPRPVTSANEHPGEPTENPAHYLGLLEELHDSGVLVDYEYNEAKARLLEKLR
jgi:uncharacterized membrane protein YeaQ/YmgE (transglycosylase-associated protein family)